MSINPYSLYASLILLGFNFVVGLCFIWYYRKAYSTKDKLEGLFYITIGLELIAFGLIFIKIFESFKYRKVSKSVKKEIMVDPALYLAFKEKCKASGMSVCELLESYFKEFNKSSN